MAPTFLGVGTERQREVERVKKREVGEGWESGDDVSQRSVEFSLNVRSLTPE
jgi:hypothetical protein